MTLLLLGLGTGAAHADPRIVGWGSQPNLGLGASSGRVAPTALASAGGEAAATSAAVGGTSTLAVVPQGVVAAGEASLVNGFLGLGSTTTVDPRERFFAVPGTAGATQVANGADGKLVLRTDKTVLAFGRNVFGAAGRTPGTVTDTATAVTGLSAVEHVAAGARHSLALRSDGSVWTWGRTDLTSSSSSPVAGDGGTPVPVTLPGGQSATQIAAGSAHNLALLANGSVAAWGLNTYGQVGDGTTTAVAAPKAVYTPPSGRTVTQVAAGATTSFALLDDGSYVAWGRNHVGQLGLGNGGVNAPTPTAPVSTVPTRPALAEIVAHSNTTLARTAAGGEVYGWGQNTNGLLGAQSVTYEHVFPYAGDPAAPAVDEQEGTEIPQRVAKLRAVPWLAVGYTAGQQLAPTEPTLVVTVNNQRLPFFGQPLGTVSATRGTSVQSVGAPSTISRVRIIGANADDFSIVGFNEGVTLPHTVPASGGFGVRVRFTPTALGTRTATLLFEADGETAAIALEGVGTPLNADVTRVVGPTGAPGPAGPAGPQGPAGANGRDGAGGTIAFAASRTVTTVKRGRTARLPFVLVNGSGQTLARTTATATVPRALRVSGRRSVAVASLATGRSRTVTVPLKVGRTAKLGRHAVKVRLKVGTRTVTRTVRVRVTR